MNRENIAALLDLVAWGEDRLGLETVEIGKPADVEADLIAELVGRNLNYWLIVDGNTISLHGSGADQIQQSNLLLNVKVDRQNVRLIATLIKKLELSGLTNLDQKPIELGDIGPSGIVLDV